MIFSNTTKKRISVISMFMVMIMGFATAFAPVSTYAAEDDGYGVGDKVKLVHDHQIRYGSGDGGYSNLMEAHGIDDSLGNRPVFCTQPNMPTPSAGTYTIDKMYTSDSGKADVLRKLVYYAKGYAKADEKVTIVDTVKYTGLYKNKEYVMKGTLMDKETGKPLLDKEGKEITAEQKFTAKSDNGTVEMSFTFDASLMQGKTTVVFESVFYNDLEVAVHSDIEDEGQTVTFEQPPAEHSPKTGDNLPMIPIVALIIASAAGISAALIRRKHKAGSDDFEE